MLIPGNIYECVKEGVKSFPSTVFRKGCFYRCEIEGKLLGDDGGLYTFSSEDAEIFFERRLENDKVVLMADRGRLRKALLSCNEEDRENIIKVLSCEGIIDQPYLDDFTTIKTYEDACLVLHETAVDERALRTAGVPHDIIAEIKLRTIAKALNRGVQVRWFSEKEMSYYYHSIFEIKWKKEKVTKAEEKTALPIRGKDGKEGYFVTSLASNAFSYNGGRRFLFKNANVAAYFGMQFIRLWADYLLPLEYKINDNE